MKRRVLLGLLVAFLVLVAVVLVRGLTSSSRQVHPPAVELPEVDADAVAARVAEAIRFPTVSDDDRAKIAHEAWQGLHAWLAETYPKTWSTLKVETVTDYGLMLTWPGSDASLPPVVLCAHLDVVPADPTRWKHPPFAGVVEGGWVWGRGAMDDKGVAITQLEAVEALVATGFRPARTVILAYGQDEEVGGARGAVKIVERLEQRLNGQRAHFVVDEGLAVTHGLVPGVDPPVGFVGVAEKGFLSLTLTVEGTGGHSSMPPLETSVGILANAVARVEAQQMPASMKGLPTLTFETLGPELPLPQKIVMANLWLFEPIVRRSLNTGNASRALLRTTTAPTMLTGSPKNNVLAQEATATINFRIKPGDTVRGVIEHVTAAVDDPRVKIAEMKGRTGDEPSPVSPAEGPGYDELVRAVREVMRDVIMAPNLVVGQTDGRHYTRVADRVYRFTPMRVDKETLKGLHGVDERIQVSNLVEMVHVYRRVIELAAGPG